MIVMEGLMLVPPDRETIIGRAIWKPRYVVFGTGLSRIDALSEGAGEDNASRKALKSTSSKPSLVDDSQEDPEDGGMYLSIYKSKGEWEFISRQPLSAFKSCEIRALAHRKHVPALPTLMLELKPAPTSENALSRRSSRTSGLTSKDPWANMLLFRSIPDERYNIYDWQVTIKPQLIPESAEDSPINFDNMSTSDQEDEVPSSSRADQPPLHRPRMWESGTPVRTLLDIVEKKILLENNSFKYKEIAYNNEIRILKILRGKKGSTLECMLFPSSLRSTNSTSNPNCHEYWALSYWWGDDEPTHPVIMYDDAGFRDGLQITTPFNTSGTLYVRNNLAAALHQFRKESEDVNVWVDALCINQANLEETTAQVKIMDEIYNKASFVCIWLGAGKRETKETFDFLESILNLEALDNLVKTKAKAENWMLVVNLMKNRWFSRSWSIQELASARRAVVCWGSEELEWPSFSDAIALCMAKRDEIMEILHETYLVDSTTRTVFGDIIPWLESSTRREDPGLERNKRTAADGAAFLFESNLFESKSKAVNPVLLEESESDSDFSVNSLDSVAVSAIASSATSVSHMAPIARDSATEIANLISNDRQLRELLDKAFDSLDPGKVTRNFRRTLLSFSQELIVEARTQSQQQAAKFVGQKSRQISVLIREKLHPGDRLNLPSHNIESVSQERLQRFLEGIQTVSTLEALYPPTPDAIGDDDSDEEEHEHDDSDDHPDLTRLREWFLSANAMQSLRDRFRSFLYPEKPATLEGPGDKESIKDLETQDNLQQVQVLTQEEHDILPDQAQEQGDRGGSRPPVTQPHASKMSFIPSSIWNYIDAKKPLGPGLVRLEWTCNCGHTSHDDFLELRPGAVAAYAEKLVQSGYATHAHSTNQAPGATSTFLTAAKNKVAAVGRNIPSLKPGQREHNPRPKARKFAAVRCSPTPGMTCRWLHLCLKQRPNAKVTKLEPLHICKDDEQKDLTDETFLKVLRRAWKTQRTWTDLMLFKLTRIEFIKFAAFPDDSVDRIVADMVPPTTEQYDFAPPPPLDMVPPIAAEHMVHLLLTECTSYMKANTFYLSQLPKKKDQPLKFTAITNLPDINVGYGLRFIETPDPSVIVTFLFVMAVVVGTVFGVCWSVFKKDMQSAWTIATYFVSIVALAVVTWQIRATS